MDDGVYTKRFWNRNYGYWCLALFGSNLKYWWDDFSGWLFVYRGWYYEHYWKISVNYLYKIGLAEIILTGISISCMNLFSMTIPNSGQDWWMYTWRHNLQRQISDRRGMTGQSNVLIFLGGSLMALIQIAKRTTFYIYKLSKKIDNVTYKCRLFTQFTVIVDWRQKNIWIH